MSESLPVVISVSINYFRNGELSYMVLKVTVPLGHITYLTQMDDTSKTFIYKKLPSPCTSINASLII